MMSFLDVVLGGIELTLDRAEPAVVAELGDQIDAGVVCFHPLASAHSRKVQASSYCWAISGSCLRNSTHSRSK